MEGRKRKTFNSISNEWEAGSILKKRKTDGSEREALLCSDDLDEVLDLLKRHGYSGTSYYDLGLYLGLVSRTLDVIKENNKGDVNSSLRECLQAWLKQADNVKIKGGSTYYSLIQALRKLEENTVADGIEREKHPACVIFSAQCESNESVIAALPSLAILLHNEKIIGTMLVPTGELLLKAVKEAICADYHNLEKFAIVLKELQNTSSIGQSLLDEYKRLYSTDYTLINSGKEKGKEMKAELYKIDGLFYSLLQEKDTELQEVVQMQKIYDTQDFKAKRVFLEHFIELSVVMAVTSNRLSIAKRLFDSNLISETSFHRATEDDTVSGIESGIVFMKDLKASINQRPDLISSLVMVLEGNEAFRSIAKRIGEDIPPTLRMYYGQVLYEIKTPGVEWLMRIIFGRDQNTLELYIKYRFINAKLASCRSSFSFTFNDADGYIELCFNKTVEPKGWSVRPDKSPVIVSRYDIEKYGNLSPPQFSECLVTIRATPDEDTVEKLNYPVTIKGVTSNIEKIDIVLARVATASSFAGIKSMQTRKEREGDIDFKTAKRKIKQVMIENYSNFNGLMQFSLVHVANKLFEAHMIPPDVQSSPTYDAIVTCFLSMMNLSDSKPDLEKHCMMFLEALSSVGGPIEFAANLLREKWTTALEGALQFEY